MRFAHLVLVCSCLVGLIGCRSPRQEARLQGTWHSNKDETVSAWRREGVLPSKVIDRFEQEVLGKMTVTYSERRVTSRSGDWTEVSEYRVVESGDDFVVFDQYSDVYKRVLRWKVRFVEDGYWIYNDEILKGYTEKFDRVRK